MSPGVRRSSSLFPQNFLVLFVDNALQIVEQLVDIADIGANTFTLKVPTHGVAAVRVPL